MFPGHKPMPWGSLGVVRFVRDGHWLTNVLFGKVPNFRLMVGTKENPSAVCVFETTDKALVLRIKAAIDRAADALGAGRSR